MNNKTMNNKTIPNKIILVILLGIVFLVLLFRLANISGVSTNLTNNISIEHFNNVNINNTENNQDKVAFLFLTRNNLKRLDIWEEFLKGDKTGNESRHSIYCHAKEPYAITDKLLKENIIPEYMETCWGCINVVEANIILMKNALKDPQNKKFMLVSESCAPIVSFNTFYNTIMKDDKSRVGIHKINSSPDRFNAIVNPEFKKEQFIKHSGQGCIFNRKHAQMLVDSLPKLENWKTMSCVDEHYNGNILLTMDKDFDSNNSNIKTTFDIWQKEDLNLSTINDDDLQTDSYILLKKVSNKAIDNMRSNGFLFIRKIDEHTIFDKNYIMN